MAESTEAVFSNGLIIRIPYDRRENILFKFPDTWMPTDIAKAVAESAIKVIERLEGKESVKEKKPTTQQRKREGVTTDVTQDTTTSLKESLCKTCASTCTTKGTLPVGVDCDMYQKKEG